MHVSRENVLLKSIAKKVFSDKICLDMNKKGAAITLVFSIKIV